MRQRQAAGNAANHRYDRLAIECGLRPSERGGDNGSDDQGQQHVELRQMIFARQLSEHDNQDNRSQSDAESARIYMAAAERQPEAIKHMPLSRSAITNTGEVSELG